MADYQIKSHSQAEQIAALVFAQLPNEVTCVVGRRDADAINKPPSVALIPMGAPTIDSATNQPGDPLYANAGRQLLVRHFAYELQCHDVPDRTDAEGFSRVEVLYLDALRAIRAVTGATGYAFGNERWIDQQENQDGWVKHGTLITCDVVIDVPVYDKRGTIVLLTNTPQILTRRYLNDEEETT